MFIHCLPNRDVATITLRIPLLLDSPDAANETFIVQYDPDNIQSAVDVEGTADRDVVLSRLSLDAPTPSLHTLSLWLKSPCPLWCPHQRPLLPKPGCEASFGALVQLAKATVVHLVFDYARLRHPRLQRCYKLFVNQPEKLAPFRIEHHFSSKGLDRCDWRAVDLPDAAPPAYAESVNKRHWPGKSPAPATFPPKADPGQVSSLSLEPSSPPRPSKKPRSESPRDHSQSDTDIASNNSYLDHQDDIIERDKCPGHLLEDPKPPIPTSPTTNIAPPAVPLTPEKLSRVPRAELVSAVREVLPQVLDGIFPTLVFTVAANTASEPTNLQQAEALLLPYILARLRRFPHLQSVDDYISEANDAEARERVVADIECEELLESHRLTLEELSTDRLADMEREADKHLEKVRQLKRDLKRARSRARKTSERVDADARVAASVARSNVNLVVSRAERTADAKIEDSLRSASDVLEQVMEKRLRDAERRLDTMFATRMHAWRRRVFRHGKLRKRGQGAFPGGLQNSKIRKMVPEPSIEQLSDDTQTTEDEL